jgi:hypothetical protein
MDNGAFLLDEDGHIIDAQVFDAQDDHAALIHAYKYINGHDVEVWRCIGFLPRESKSISLDE